MKKFIDTNVPTKKPSSEQDSRAELDKQNDFFTPGLRRIILIILFVAAFIVRIYGIEQAPLIFHPNRQYHGAMIARAFYYRLTKPAADQQRQIAQRNRDQEVKGEMPFLEIMATAGYLVAGREILWLPKLFSVIFWLIGSVFLYRFVRRVVSADAAVVSLLFFLFLPYGIEASRSFQPNPLMIMFLIISISTVYNYFEQATLKNLLFAAIFSSLTLFTYPFSVFPVLIMFIVLAFYSKGFLGALKNWHYWFWGVITILPTAVYFYYTASNIESYARTAFGVYQILSESFFWRGWMTQIEHVFSIAALIAGLAGLLIFPKGRAKVLVLALWLSYAVYGLIIPYHIHTHDYYQLLLLPTVAISIGALAAPACKWLGDACSKWFQKIPPLTVLFFAVFVGIVTVLPRLYVNGIDEYVQFLEQIGDTVNHSMKTMFLTDYYGKPLVYHGQISGLNWPSSADFRATELSGGKPERGEELFKKRFESQKGSEFFIVTDFREFEAQQDLRQFLTQTFPVFTQSRSLLIFDLRKKLTGK